MGIADLTGGVVKGCVQWLDLGQREQDAGHLQYVHVPLAVLDAVFSINTKYKAAQNVVARYRAYAEVDDNQEHSITTFLQLASNFGPDDFAGQVLKNRQRTSTRGGILKAEAAIDLRLGRVKRGNFGQCELLGGGVYELKIDFGPGYRVYFGKTGLRVVLLLCAGSKRSQRKDIERAKKYLQDSKTRGLVR